MYSRESGLEPVEDAEGDDVNTARVCCLNMEEEKGKNVSTEPQWFQNKSLGKENRRAGLPTRVNFNLQLYLLAASLHKRSISARCGSQTFRPSRRDTSEPTKFGFALSTVVIA
jgi:hypothetical protein